jgi:hypothetical protein
LNLSIPTILLLTVCLWPSLVQGQQDAAAIKDTVQARQTAGSSHILPLSKQVDLIDLVYNGLKKDPSKRADTSDRVMHTRVSAIPALGYTLLTGFAGIAEANIVFNTSSLPQPNESNILTSVTYSQYHQLLVPLQSNIWSGNNKYNFQSDWRYLKYPSYTYGLGGYTLPKDAYAVNFDYLRFYQNLTRIIVNNVYGGIGFDVDYLWNIEELDPPEGQETDFEKYGFYPIEKAAGITLSLLYDTRGTPVNPLGGAYGHVVYRSNYQFLGSSNDWQSIQFDLRKYFRLSPNNENVLAFWSYDWFTLSGNPPYLLLPSTGWDPYNNTGRGYIQGRYRGKDMLYLETEYRFQITRKGLIGGVIFANAQSFSEITSSEFQVVEPGAGFGIRIKLNKFSRTNLAVDYGFGLDGSQGFSVNLGEVF